MLPDFNALLCRLDDTINILVEFEFCKLNSIICFRFICFRSYIFRYIIILILKIHTITIAGGHISSFENAS